MRIYRELYPGEHMKVKVPISKLGPCLKEALSHYLSNKYNLNIPPATIENLHVNQTKEIEFSLDESHVMQTQIEECRKEYFKDSDCFECGRDLRYCVCEMVNL